MPIKLNTASGGGVILQGANTASDKTITVPAADTTMVGTDSTQTLSNKTFSGAQTFGTASLAEPSGSAPLYMCRAWVNFNGTGTVAIRASGNVSSITDNGTGDYTVNFTTAMPDANYGVVGIGNRSGNANVIAINDGRGAPLAGAVYIYTGSAHASGTSAGVFQDVNYVYVAVLR